MLLSFENAFDNLLFFVVVGVIFFEDDLAFDVFLGFILGLEPLFRPKRGHSRTKQSNILGLFWLLLCLDNDLDLLLFLYSGLYFGSGSLILFNGSLLFLYLYCVLLLFTSSSLDLRYRRSISRLQLSNVETN